MPGPIRTLMPHSPGGYKRKPSAPIRKRLFGAGPIVASTLVLTLAFFSLPSILSMDLKAEQSAQSAKPSFPISVNPSTKTITENPSVEGLLIKEGSNPALTAAATQAQGVFAWLASVIASLPVYKLVAGAGASQFVTIDAGSRQEQVASEFGTALAWTPKQRTAFLTQVHNTAPTLSEGEFVPGTYEVNVTASASDVQNVLNNRFSSEILARYSSSTAEQVPLGDALTIASLLEREAAGPEDMRLISGIIWNRLFVGMNLQIDATLQYVKADTAQSWWPRVLPKDKYLKSAFNTYQHPGLPPAPIANPSIAAVIAALNPKKTDCLFYFHDKYGQFHCSVTYTEHVKMLKKYYGRGK